MRWLQRVRLWLSVYQSTDASSRKNQLEEGKQDWLVQKFGLRRPQRDDTIQVERPFSPSYSSFKNTKEGSSGRVNLVCKSCENYTIYTNSFFVCSLFLFREIIQIFQDNGKLFQQLLKSSHFYFLLQFHPPEYSVENMATPAVLFSGSNDKLASPKDVQLLKKRITNLRYFQEIKGWNHADFLFGNDAPSVLYSKMLDMIEVEQFLGKNMAEFRLMEEE